MKNIILSTLILMFCVSSLFSQNNKLSVEVGGSWQMLCLDQLNKTFISELKSPASEVVNPRFNQGYSGDINVKYQWVENFDLGIYFNYLSANHGFQLGGGSPDPNSLNLEMQINNIAVGISNAVHLHELLNFSTKENQFLNRLNVMVDFRTGLSNTNSVLSFYIQEEQIFEGNPYTISSSVGYGSNFDFHGQVALKISYDFLKKDVFSGIGFKVGYQYLKTNELTTLRENKWIVTEDSEPMRYDLSGLFLGTFLVIGK